MGVGGGDRWKKWGRVSTGAAREETSVKWGTCVGEKLIDEGNGQARGCKGLGAS